MIDAQDVDPRRPVVDAVQQPVGSAASAERTSQLTFERLADSARFAAKGAIPAWGSTTPSERATVLRQMSSALRDRSEALVDTLVGEVGTSVGLARSSHVGQALAALDSYVDLLEEFLEIKAVQMPVRGGRPQ